LTDLTVCRRRRRRGELSPFHEHVKFEAVAWNLLSVKESTDTDKWREVIGIGHQPKQLDHRVEAAACHQ
jgi:hypothetical protein